MGAPRERGKVGRLVGFLFILTLKAVATALIVAIPLAGVWAASSLAVYANGPVELALASGLLLFPIGPLLWEAFASWRRGRKASPKPHILTFFDRVLWRTLLLNLAFLGVLLGTRPATGFLALSTRGDWMLDGRDEPWVPGARRHVLATADTLEWLYLAVHEDTYAKGQDPTDTPTPGPAPSPTRTVVQLDAPAGTPTPAPAPATTPPPTATPTPTATPSPAPTPAPATTTTTTTATASPTAPAPPAAAAPIAGQWPLAAVLHPLVSAIPASAEVDVETLAKYIRDREPDPLRRLKAFHDWAADRIRYDVPALSLPRLPPQDPVTVLRERKAVCAGYALLLEALGRAAGDEIVYVSGDVRSSGSGMEPGGHAWNAAKVGGKWVLVDATWDAGGLEDGAFQKRYQTNYFLTPPEIFGLDHFPREDRWQLRDAPLSRGDFLRQPLVTPEFLSQGLRMVWPDRSQVTVDEDLWLTIENGQGRFLLARFGPKDYAERDFECEVHNGPRAKIHCAFPAPGTFDVAVFSGPRPYGSFEYVGRVEVNRR